MKARNIREKVERGLERRGRPVTAGGRVWKEREDRCTVLCFLSGMGQAQ